MMPLNNNNNNNNHHHHHHHHHHQVIQQTYDSPKLMVELGNNYIGGKSKTLSLRLIIIMIIVVIQSNLDYPDFSIIRTFSLVPFFS